MIEFTDELEKRVWVATFELSSVYYVNVAKKHSSVENYIKTATCEADNIVTKFRKTCKNESNK